MILADYIDFKTARVLDQGKTPTCSSHAFFMALSEHVQQEHGLDLEFDYIAEYSRMKKWRAREIEKSSLARRKYSRYVPCYFKIGQDEGFRATTGELVKVKSWIKVFGQGEAWRTRILKELQKYGPVVFAVRRYYEHSLKDGKDGIIEDVPAGAKEKRTGHVMILRGFDRTKQLLKFQNSWGEEASVRWMRFSTFSSTINGEPLAKYAYSIRKTTIN